MMLLSLSIAVYNKPENLRLVLMTCARQTLNDFEVIVADDGSGPDIARVVEEARGRCRFPIQHLWHEDLGWRKNVMLNNAIRAARSDYLVFIDGDCLLHHKFLEDHWTEREPRTVLCGRRVEMGERWARQLDEDFIRSGRYQQIGLAGLWDAIRGDAHRIEDGLRFSSRFVADLLHGKSGRILGSNFSLHRQDLESINGFDELYTGPGHGEDSDLQYRLELTGIHCKPLRHRGIQYHIYHPRTVMAESSGRRFEEVKRRGEAWCEHGLE